MRGQPEIGLRFRPLSTKMCAHVNADSALHNADADPDEGGSDDEWLARAKQKGVRVRSQHGALVCVVAQDDLEETEAIPVCFMTWKSKASKRTILSTFGAKASECRDSLDLAEYTRAMLCEVVTGGRVLDRGTSLMVASLREGCSAGVGRDQKRSGLMWLPTRVQLADGLTKSSAGVFLGNALTSGTAQLHEESTKVLRKKQLTSSSKEVRDVSAVQRDLEQKDWWQ